MKRINLNWDHLLKSTANETLRNKQKDIGCTRVKDQELIMTTSIKRRMREAHDNPKDLDDSKV